MERIALGLVLACALLGSACGPGRRADLAVTGTIRTMNPAAPVASAMAVGGGRILYVGDDPARARAMLGAGGRVLALGPGQMAMPGLVDAHVHMLEAGLLQLDCAVDDPKTTAALLDALAACAAAEPDRPWFVGSGWPIVLFDERGPRKEQLDAIVPDRPAVVWGQDGHSAWLNSRALAAAGIDAGTSDPTGGRIERVPGTSEPAGTLRESAMALVDQAMPPPNAETLGEGLGIGQRTLHALGITQVQDANVSPRLLEAYAAAARSGALTMKVVAAQATDPGKPASQVDDLVALRDRHAFGRLSAGTAKIFVDGVLEARTAALLEPYDESPDGPADRGSTNWTPEQLAAIATRLDAAGFQIHLHAIGDRAIRDGLDAIAAARRTNGASDRRHQIAHLELADPADIPRLAELDVTANFQPYWMFADPSIAKDIEPLLGPERTARLYAMRSFEEAGARLAIGSDWPVSTANPFLAIQIGMTRQDPADPANAPWSPGQRASLDTLLAAYTTGGARVNQREHETGSLEIGKAADFVVLDRDLAAIPPTSIGGTRVLATFVDGVAVHEDDEENTR